MVRATKSSTPTITMTTTPMMAPDPEPFEKAMPVLNARLKRRVQMTSMISPPLSRSSAHDFDIWSIARTATATPATMHQRHQLDDAVESSSSWAAITSSGGASACPPSSVVDVSSSGPSEPSWSGIGSPFRGAVSGSCGS